MKIHFAIDWQLVVLFSLAVLMSVNVDGLNTDITPPGNKDPETCDSDAANVDPLMPRGWSQNCKSGNKAPDEETTKEVLPPESKSSPPESQPHHLEEPVSPTIANTQSETTSNKSGNLEYLKNSYQFCHRFLKAIQYHLKSKGLSAGTYIKLNIDADDLHTLLRLELSDNADLHCPISDAFDILTEGIHLGEKQHSNPSESSWISSYQQSFLSVLLQVTSIIFMVVNILYIMLSLWNRLGSKRFSLFLVFAVFWTSVPWTYIHLYKQNLAERIHRLGDGVTDRDCQLSNIPWYDLFLGTYAKKCETYYQDIIVDPLWEVKPTQAVATTFVEFVWSPLAVMGEPLGKFIQGLLDPLPFLMKPVVCILGLFFLGFVITINSGIRIWTWFFTLEPANLAQHQLTAMNDTIESIRAVVETGSSNQQQRDNRVNDVLARLDRQLTQRDDLNEMLPVLDRFCAEYSHQSDAQTHKPEAGDASRAGNGDQSSYSAAADSHVVVSQISQSASLEITRPDHIVMTTSQSDKVLDFYQRIGFQVGTFSSNKEIRTALFIKNFKINIHILGKEIQPHAKNPSSGTLDICLVCRGAVETTLKRLKERGVEPELGPVQRTGAVGPIMSVYIRDPDCNLIELAHYKTRQCRKYWLQQQRKHHKTPGT